MCDLAFRCTSVDLLRCFVLCLCVNFGAYLIFRSQISQLYGEVWARRNVYSAPPRYYKCTATHGTPREAHAGPRGVVQQIPKGLYNTQGVSTLTPHICS